jgi:aconitate hydratase
MHINDPFGARTNLTFGSGEVEIYSLKALDERVTGDVFSLPFSVRVLLESLLRSWGGKFVYEEDVVFQDEAHRHGRGLPGHRAR